MLPLWAPPDWVVNSIPEALGAFIGVLGALFIFQFQIEIDRKKKAVEKQEEQKVNTRYFSVLLESTKDTVKKQISEFDKYADKILQNPHLQLTSIPHYPIQDLNRLITFMNDKNTLNSFLSIAGDQKENIIEYDQISKSLDYFDIGYKQISEEADRCFQLEGERRIKYDQIVRDQMNKLLNYCLENIPRYDEILLVITNLEASREDRINLLAHSNTIVMPVIKLFQEKKYPDHTLKSIFYELTQALRILDQIQDNNKIFAELVKTVSIDFQKSFDKLENNSRNIMVKSGLIEEDELNIKPLGTEKLKDPIILEKGTDESSLPI